LDELSRDDVLQILELIDKSEFDFFELESGELKLTISKTPLPATRTASATPMPASTAPRSEEPVSSPPSTPPPVTPPRPAEETAPAAGLVPVKAEMVGTYYAQPEPGAPPYVHVGSRVEDDSVVGLIEVMKVFTPVHAGARGVVTHIVVQNAQFVEFGQTLLLVKPDEA
jgi:acetyl-CoA carboxylase biotin carboxyl carrier protein